MLGRTHERRINRSNRPRAALCHFLAGCGGVAVVADEHGRWLASSESVEPLALTDALTTQRFGVGGRAFLLSVLEPLTRNLGETTLGCARILATTG